MNVTTTMTASPLLLSFNDTSLLSSDHPAAAAATTAAALLHDLATTLAGELLGGYNATSASPANASVVNGSLAGAGEEENSSLGPPYMQVEKYVVPAVCVTGIVLNVLNLLVLTERCLKESPYTYLTAMAVLCVASLSMTFLSYVFIHNFPHNYYCFLYTFHFYYPCVNICANSTMWLTATLTIERFLFVRHPLWARAKCDRRSAKMKICVIIVLMMLLNIPRFLLYKVVPHPDKSVGPGSYHYEYTAFRRSQAFVVISWIYSATIQVIPMSILCVTNFYLVYAVHRARRLRKRMQIRNNMEAEWSREQMRLTITLISIVFFFVICIMPSAFSDIHVAYALFGRGQGVETFRQSHAYLTFGKIANFLVFCQLSFNFVLYSAFNDKFLAVFKRMLRRWAERVKRRVGGKRNNNNNNSSSSASMFRLMRLDKVSGEGPAEERDGHKRQLRSSNNSMSSGGKDLSQTKTSLLDMGI